MMIGRHPSGKKCDKFPPKGSTRDDYAKFYDWHTTMVRDFAKEHPALHYLEVSLEALDAGIQLEKQTGINASCWFNSTVQKKRSFVPIVSSFCLIISLSV